MEVPPESSLHPGHMTAAVPSPQGSFGPWMRDRRTKVDVYGLVFSLVSFGCRQGLGCCMPALRQGLGCCMPALTTKREPNKSLGHGVQRPGSCMVHRRPSTQPLSCSIATTCCSGTGCSFAHTPLPCLRCSSGGAARRAPTLPAASTHRPPCDWQRFCFHTTSGGCQVALFIAGGGRLWRTAGIAWATASRAARSHRPVSVH